MKKLFNRNIGQGSFKLNLTEDGLEDYLKDFHSPEKEVVKNILQHLFQSSKSENDRRSIIHSDRFDIYFDNILKTEGILFREFTPMLDQPWDKVKMKFDSWVAEKREGYLVDILRSLNAFENPRRFQTITRLWVMLANLDVRSEFVLSHWIQLISDNKPAIEKFFGLDKTFFFSLFRPNQTCFFYHTYVIRLLLRNYIDKKENFFFPLSQEELQALSVERLDEFIQSRTKFDVRAFGLFYYNCWKTKTSENNAVIMDEANVRIRGYIEKYPTEYLRFTIRSKHTPHLDGLFLFEPFTKQYFKGWEEFETFLSAMAAREPEFQDMVKYFEEFKKSGYAEFFADPMPKWLEADENGNSTMKYFKGQTLPAFTAEMTAKYP